MQRGCVTKLSSCERTIRAVRSLLKLVGWLSCACGIHLTSARPLETSRVTQESQTSLVHTVVPTECNPYQDWQAGSSSLLILATASTTQSQPGYVPFKQVLGLYWSWKKVGSPGMFTRIACCEFDRLKVLMPAAACM